MTLKLATWNINSVRLRLENVQRLLETEAPDVLCLQEIKTLAETFPATALAEFGSEHQAVHGQRGYHGVAIVSKRPFAKTWTDEHCERGHARHVAVSLENGIELHNFYVPSGGDIPDPKLNDKFAHKLAFLAELERHFSRQKDGTPRILVGDLNVAPHENDVWSHRQLIDVVSHTPVEVDHLLALKASLDWHDVSRDRARPDEKLYSWWSYRARDWAASDRGRRLDHIWLTPALKSAVLDHRILRDVRSWDKASDHVPVTATLDL